VSPGPPQITQHEFEGQLRRYLQALDGGVELTPDDYAAIIRLWNTLSWGEVSVDESLAAAFKARVFPSEVPTMTKLLDMVPSKGLGLYSRERDLYLGGAPDDNSRYEITPDA
jgi:hypothetical protein